MLLNTGRRLETKVDRIAAHMDHPYLRVHGLPVVELADQLLVLRLSFNNLPEHLDQQVAEDQLVWLQLSSKTTRKFQIVRTMLRRNCKQATPFTY